MALGVANKDFSDAVKLEWLPLLNMFRTIDWKEIRRKLELSGVQFHLRGGIP